MTTDYLKDAEAAMGLAITNINGDPAVGVFERVRAAAFKDGLYEGRRIIRVALARRDTAMAKYAEMGLWEHLEAILMEAFDSDALDGKSTDDMSVAMVALERPVIEEALQAAKSETARVATALWQATNRDRAASDATEIMRGK